MAATLELRPRHTNTPGSATTTPRARVAALDGIRGVAIIAVLLFHAGHLRGGFLGVDLFFVLSGYLITSLLLRERQHRGTVSLRSFWTRRARRLLPALVVLAFVVVVGGRLLTPPSRLAGLRGDLLATFTYSANWRFIATGTNYWSRLGGESLLQHVWSLAIEEQFYLVWPIALLCILRVRRGPLAVAVAATGAACASTVAMAGRYSPADVTRAYFGTDTHAAPVLVGAALAAVLTARGEVRGHRSRAVLEIAALVAAAALIWAATQLDGQRAVLYHGGFLVCALAGAVVVAAAVHARRGPLGRALSWRPLCWLGTISYGVYLFHWPLFVSLTPARTGIENGAELNGLRIAASVLLAWCSFRLVERPIRLGRLPRRAVALAIPGTAVALVAVTLLVTTDAASGRALGVVADTGGPPRRARSDTRVMVVGDSIALSVGTGLGSFAARDHLMVWNRGFIGCGLIRTPTQNNPRLVTTALPDCLDYPVHWTDDLDRFDPQIVVLVASAWDLLDRHVGHHTVAFGTPAWDRLYRSALDHAFDTLTARGARVVALTAPCIDQRAPNLSADYRAAFREPRVRHLDALVREIADARPSDVTVADLHALVCPGGRYAASLHGADDIRGDGIHFSSAGRRIVGSWLAQVLDGARVGRRAARAARILSEPRP